MGFGSSTFDSFTCLTSFPCTTQLRPFLQAPHRLGTARGDSNTETKNRWCAAPTGNTSNNPQGVPQERGRAPTAPSGTCALGVVTVPPRSRNKRQPVRHDARAIPKDFPIAGPIAIPDSKTRAPRVGGMDWPPPASCCQSHFVTMKLNKRNCKTTNT